MIMIHELMKYSILQHFVCTVATQPALSRRFGLYSDTLTLILTPTVRRLA